MSSKLRTIADSLAAGLAAATLPIAASVQRQNWAHIDVDQMANPVVFVTPGGADTTLIGRKVWQTDNTALVFVGRRVAVDADVNAMFDLADEIYRLIRSHSWGNTWPSGITYPVNVAIDINPDDALNERNVWRAIITATYREISNDS